MTETAVPARYRKRPVEIEAVQWTGENLDTVRAWTGDRADGHPIVDTVDSGLMLWVEANGAWLALEVSEWVIRDQLGFYPCKAEVFAATYDAVEATA